MSNFFDAAGIDLGIVVLILIILVLVLMLMTLNLSLGLHRLRTKYKVFMRGKDAQSLERLFNSKFREIDRLVTISDVQMSDIKALKANYNKEHLHDQPTSQVCLCLKNLCPKHQNCNDP